MEIESDNEGNNNSKPDEPSNNHKEQLPKAIEQMNNTELLIELKKENSRIQRVQKSGTRSIVWLDFDILFIIASKIFLNKVICKHCDEIYSYNGSNTTTMGRHNCKK